MYLSVCRRPEPSTGLTLLYGIFIDRIANSVIKRKKCTHRAFLMNQIYVGYVHQIKKYAHLGMPDESK